MPTPLGQEELTVLVPDAPVGEQFPLIGVGPGASYTKDDMTWISEHLASHGFMVVTVTPTFLFGVNVQPWGEALVHAIEQVQADAAGSGTPAAGRFDGRLGLLGYSAGGGGAMVAAGMLPDVETVVGLAPATNLLGAPASIEQPFLQVCGELDTAVNAEACNAFHDNHAEDHVRETLFLMGHDHWVFTNEAENPEVPFALSRRYATAWFELFLKDAQHRRGVLFGDGAMADVASGAIGDLRYVMP